MILVWCFEFGGRGWAIVVCCLMRVVVCGVMCFVLCVLVLFCVRRCWCLGSIVCCSPETSLFVVRRVLFAFLVWLVGGCLFRGVCCLLFVVFFVVRRG